MIIIGWRKGKECVLRTDSALKLMQFAGLMDRVEYIHNTGEQK